MAFLSTLIEGFLTFFGRRLQDGTQKIECHSDYLVFSFKIATIEIISRLGNYEIHERREKASNAVCFKDESDRQ